MFLSERHIYMNEKSEEKTRGHHAFFSTKSNFIIFDPLRENLSKTLIFQHKWQILILISNYSYAFIIPHKVLISWYVTYMDIVS